MKFLKFDEFLGESALNLFENSEVINEAGLTEDIDKKIKFGIIMATHPVADDGGRRAGRLAYKSQESVFRDTIKSIKNQSHKNWKLFICGDYFEDESFILDILNDLLDKSQYEWFNLPTPGERENKKITDNGYMHKLGGTTAWNKSYAMIRKDKSCNYAIKMGHDDVWRDDHLETHAKAYTQYPEAKVAWTRVTKKRFKDMNKGLMKWPTKEVSTIDYDNLEFREGNTLDVYSFDIKSFPSIKWRALDQLTTAPRRKEIVYNDIDMYNQINQMLKDNEWKSIYVPKPTYKYRNKKGQLP